MTHEIHGAGRAWTEYLDGVLMLAQHHLGCDGCGITVRGAGGRSHTLAASNAVVGAADELQSRCADGPAVSPAWPRSQVVISDTSRDDLWPVWSRALVELGVASVLATQILTPRNRNGSLTLYFRRRVELRAADLTVADRLARQVGERLGHADEVTQLRTAIASRTVIGQAQGLLMERYGLTPERAFALLQRHSQHTNVKLREVAATLTRTGRLDVGCPAAASDGERSAQ